MVLVAVVGAVPRPAAAIGDIQEAIDGALRDLPRLSQKLDPKYHTVAIFPFKSDESMKGAGSVLQDKIVKVLLDTGRFKVIDREALEALLKEQALSLTGIVEERADMVRVGKVAGADVFMYGSASVSGQTLTLTLKMVEVQTSAIVWQEALQGESSEGGGRVGLAVGYFLIPVSMHTDFNTKAANSPTFRFEGMGMKDAYLTGAPEPAFKKSLGGPSASLSYRQPFPYSRAWGFGVDLTGGLAFDPGEFQATGLDAANGNQEVTVIASVASVRYIALGGIIFYRTRELTGGHVDRINPYIGFSAGMVQVGVDRAKFSYATGGGGNITTPNTKGLGMFAARLGTEVLFTRHLSLEVEAALPLAGATRLSDNAAMVITLEKPAGLRAFGLLRYNF